MYPCLGLLFINYCTILGSSAVRQRPLPPVPGTGSTSVPSSPVEIKKHPLPAPPVPSGVHINPVGPQTSPLVKKKNNPPPKPAPYRKNKSEPSPPPSVIPIEQPSFQPRFCRSASLSPPPSVVLVEDYQECVTQSQPENYEFGLEQDFAEDNYSLATSGE